MGETGNSEKPPLRRCRPGEAAASLSLQVQFYRFNAARFNAARLSQRVFTLVAVAAVAAAAAVAARSVASCVRCVLEVEAHALHAGHQRTGGDGAVQLALGGGQEAHLQRGLRGRYLLRVFHTVLGGLHREAEGAQAVQRHAFGGLQVAGHYGHQVVDDVLRVAGGEGGKLGNLLGHLVGAYVPRQHYAGIEKFLALFVGKNRLE